MKSFFKARVVAGVTVGAILALSRVDSALAQVSCPANSEDVNDSDSDGVLGTAAALSNCICGIGYAPDGTGGCQSCTLGTTLFTPLDVTHTPAQNTCGRVAPAYYGAPGDWTTAAMQQLRLALQISRK